MIRFYRVGLIFSLLFFIFSGMSFVCADENVNSTTLVKYAIDENVTDDEIISLEDYSEEITLEEKTDTIIYSQNSTFYKNSNDQYNISLKDDLGNPMANTPMIFEINNTTYNHTTDNEGYVFLNINSLELGEYIIKTRFLGNNFYNPTNATNHIIIKSTIISDDFTKVYTSDSSFKAYFLDYDGALLNNTRVGFQIRNTTYNRTTNNYGLAKQAIGLTPGNYTVTIINYYTNERITNKIEVIPQIVENSDLTKYFRSDKDFIVRIIDNNGYPVGAGKTVSFTVNGVTYTRTTDRNGYAKMQINLYPDQYTITTHYNATTVTNNLIVLSTISTSNLDMKAKDGSQFEALILDGDGNPYPNQQVSFTINNVVYNRTTNKYGIAALTINLNSGSYLIKTTYNTYYRNNYIHTTLPNSRTKVNTVLNILNLQRNVNQTGTINVKLTDNSANVLVKKSILFTINGVRYTRLTNSLGKVKLNYRLPEGQHNFTVSFSGDQDYKTKTVSDYINSGKLNSILYLGGCWTLSGEELIEFYLKDTQGNVISNEEVTFSINNNTYTNTTDNLGCAKIIVNLSPGEYNVNVNYSGSEYYYGSINSTNFSVCNSSLFSYSLIIPNYVEVTNDWTVYPRFDSRYISTTGLNGKIRIPVARELNILTPDDEYNYYMGFVAPGIYSIVYDDILDINSSDFTLHIESNMDYVNITYYGNLMGGVNNFNAIYLNNPFLDPHSEELLIYVNGIAKVSIAFSEPIFYDETGVRCAFIEDEPIINHLDYLTCRYDSYSNYNTLRFCLTNESVIYSDDLLSINNTPTYEKITTDFNYGDVHVLKDEFVGFGKLYNVFMGIDVAQSYTLSDVLINKDIVGYYVNQSFGLFDWECSMYSNFLVGLSTFWAYDDFTCNSADLLNLSVNREGTSLCLVGVEFGGRSYVHCPNPLMGLNISGENNESVLLCRAMSSLLLSEFESQALNLVGINTISSLNYLFSEILAGANFTINITENILTLKLTNDNVTLLLFDLENGTVYDIFINNSFIYKGAVSQNSEYCCPYNFLTTIVSCLSGTLNNNYGAINPKHNYASNGLSDAEKHLIGFGASASAMISATLLMNYLPYIGLAAFFPEIALPILAGVILLCVSYELNYYANDGNKGEALKWTLYDFFISWA